MQVKSHFKRSNTANGGIGLIYILVQQKCVYWYWCNKPGTSCLPPSQPFRPFGAPLSLRDFHTTSFCRHYNTSTRDCPGGELLCLTLTLRTESRVQALPHSGIRIQVLVSAVSATFSIFRFFFSNRRRGDMKSKHCETEKLSRYFEQEKIGIFCR